MKVYEARKFPARDVQQEADGRGSPPPGIHVGRLIGARYGGKGACVAYVAMLENEQPYAFRLWGRHHGPIIYQIQKATFGTVLLLEFVAKPEATQTQARRFAVDLKRCISLCTDPTAGHETPPEPRFRPVDPLGSEFVRIMAALANEARLPTPLPIPCVRDVGSGPLRIMILGCNPPSPLTPADLATASFLTGTSPWSRTAELLGSAELWLRAAATHGGGKLLDGEYLTRCATLGRDIGGDVLAGSTTGFPGLIRRLKAGRVIMKDGGASAPSVFVSWLSAVPSTAGERRPVGFGGSPTDVAALYISRLAFELIKPAIVVLSGRLAERKAGALLRPMIGLGRYTLSHLRKTRDPAGNEWPKDAFRAVDQTFRSGYSTTFIPAPDLRYFGLPLIRGRQESADWGNVLLSTIAAAARNQSRAGLFTVKSCAHPAPADREPNQLERSLTEPGARKGESVPDERGNVIVESSPPGAEISILGLPPATQPGIWHSVSPGEYTVEATREGYRPASTRIRVEPGRYTTVALRLDRMYGTVRVASTPPGLNAVLAGSRGAVNRRAVTNHEWTDIPSGEYSISLTGPNGEHLAQEITVAAAGVVCVNFVIATTTTAPSASGQESITKKLARKCLELEASIVELERENLQLKQCQHRGGALGQ